MSSKCYHWYNNGIDEINTKDNPPECYIPGRLKMSDEARKKMSE